MSADQRNVLATLLNAENVPTAQQMAAEVTKMSGETSTVVHQSVAQR